MSRLIDDDVLKAAINRETHGRNIMLAAGDVLDIIDELPDAESTRKWISVKDKLPTYAELRGDHVLVLFEDGTICSTGFDECIEDESIFGEWRQNFDMETLGATDSDWMPFEGVTHWMPLPEPPKEDDDEHRD